MCVRGGCGGISGDYQYDPPLIFYSSSNCIYILSNEGQICFFSTSLLTARVIVKRQALVCLT